MPDADVGIVGGGLAGSIAAAMLGRAGISTILIDIHQAYRRELRSEKIDAMQVDLLAQTGLATDILSVATPINDLWIARYGRLVDKRPNGEYGLAYHDFVNGVRRQIPASVRFIKDRVSAVSTGQDEQHITLTSGGSLDVRLVVIATGLNDGLRRSLGIARTTISACHSITVAFDVAPRSAARFDFPALTSFGVDPANGGGYVTLFPIQDAMRANLFLYCGSLRHPLLEAFRRDPNATLIRAMPGLDRLMGPFDVLGDMTIRPVDLYVTDGYRQAGIVLVGDAFATSCPSAGTGVSKVLTDVGRLCNVHIPRWLTDGGMGREKIGAFYADPIKAACDAYSQRQAFYMRSLATDSKLRWRTRRAGWFAQELASGAWRRVQAELAGPRARAVNSSLP